MVVCKLGVERDRRYLYYVQDGAVWRLRRGARDTAQPERVADIESSHSRRQKSDASDGREYMYFLNRQGHVERVARVARMQ